MANHGIGDPRDLRIALALSRRQSILLGIAGCAAVVHVGTAILRLGAFLPFPQSIDFSAFYVAAHAMRQRLSPYGLSSDWLSALQHQVALPFSPPPIYNPAAWPWLLQPLTYVQFPIAAWLWLILNLGLLIWCGLRLAGIAGVDGIAGKLGTLALVLTFGPVVLDLSLGQTSIVLLTAALAVGNVLPTGRKAKLAGTRSVIVYGVAVGAKLLPITWVGPLVVFRRWRALLSYGLIALSVLLLSLWVDPGAGDAYWTNFLPRRLSVVSDSAGLDDQSLLAWLQRMALPQRYAVPGLSTSDRAKVEWVPLLNVSRVAVMVVGYGSLVLLGIATVLSLARVPEEQSEAGFYLWILFTLLALPHIERYNHVLALPALAWLWSRGSLARTLGVTIYGLFALSRLNHLWIRIAPVPLGPFLSGAGTLAVLVLMFGLARELWQMPRERMERGL